MLVTGLLLLASGLGGFRDAAGGRLLRALPAAVAAGVLGLGLTLVSSTVAAVAGARPDERGLASGMLNTSRLLGGSLGVAVLSTLAGTRAANLLAAGQPRPDALCAGFHLAFAAGACMCLTGRPCSPPPARPAQTGRGAATAGGVAA